MKTGVKVVLVLAAAGLGIFLAMRGANAAAPKVFGVEAVGGKLLPKAVLSTGTKQTDLRRLLA